MDAILSSPALIALILAIALLLASAIWAHYRFADYDRLPRQFGLSLKPTSFGPAWLMTWFLPLLLIGVLIFTATLPGFVSREYINGDPEMGLIIASVICIAAEGFTLWLLIRWANSQA